MNLRDSKLKKMGICFLILFLFILVSNGRVEARVADDSEIRAIFVSAESLNNPDWDLIADTAKNYNVNTIVVNMLYPVYSFYPSEYVTPFPEDELTPAINAAHARGMKLYASFNVLFGAFDDTHKAIGSDGTSYYWTDPTNPMALSHLRNLTEELASFQVQGGTYAGDTIDGLMLDYMRYENNDMPYGEYARQSLENYLGETISDADFRTGGVFAPGGSRYNEFMEWRVHVIDDLVRDTRSWALGANPELEISAAVWGWLPGSPTQNRYWIGQDSTYWIKEGYLDWVAPMLFISDLGQLQTFIQGLHLYGTGGPEGEIPLVVFLTNAFPSPVDPDDFKQQIDTVRSNEADGWFIWRYGGPGDGVGSTAPDIRQYLDLIDLPNVFSLENIQTSSSGTQATITWTTDKPATSKVEYSTSPLFTSSFVYDSTMDFSYWDINHGIGDIVEDITPKTSHSITLTGLQEDTIYYYRVQSQDDSGIATSKVLTIMTTGDTDQIGIVFDITGYTDPDEGVIDFQAVTQGSATTQGSIDYVRFQINFNLGAWQDIGNDYSYPYIVSWSDTVPRSDVRIQALPYLNGIQGDGRTEGPFQYLGGGNETIPCTGNVNLTLSPNRAEISSRVNVSISGVNCNIYVFAEGSCDGVDPTLGWACGAAPGTDVSCNSYFTSPDTVNNYVYYACADKNSDGDYSDLGESDSEILNVFRWTCEDSDGGKDYYTRGNVSVCIAEYYGGGCFAPDVDSCKGNVLTEFFCQNNKRESVEYRCPRGCRDGACKRSSGGGGGGGRFYLYDIWNSITDFFSRIFSAFRR